MGSSVLSHPFQFEVLTIDDSPIAQLNLPLPSIRDVPFDALVEDDLDSFALKLLLQLVRELQREGIGEKTIGGLDNGDGLVGVESEDFLARNKREGKPRRVLSRLEIESRRRGVLTPLYSMETGPPPTITMV